MLAIDNKTPFRVVVVPSIDKEGNEFAVVVVKGTFDVLKTKRPLSVSENQVPIYFDDEFYGEPGKSSIRYASDICLKKVGTDVALIGNAYATQKNTTQLDVQLQVGPLSKTVRVFGQRVWIRTLGFWDCTRPAPFENIPLVYEKAFGGEDRSHPNPSKHARENCNPVGTGFVLSFDKEHINETVLPNLEDPRRLIKKVKDKPPPAGFGFIGRDWSPRVEYAGTYDEEWQRERCPWLPQDFDDRYNNSAHPDLVYDGQFKGGESVVVINASREGILRFDLPREHLKISTTIQGNAHISTPTLDTIVIEPDDKRIVLVWRAAIPCNRHFLYVNTVTIRRVER